MILKTNRRKWLGSLAVPAATVLLFVAWGKIDWTLVWLELGRTRPVWILAAVMMNLSILALWAVQWRLFLPEKALVPFRQMLEINSLISMTLNTVPFGAGHALGVALLGRRVGHAEALSVLALDQLAEGLSKVTLIMLVSLAASLPLWLSRGLPFLGLAVLLLFLALLFLAHRFAGEIEESEAGQGAWSRILAFAVRWAHHLKPMRTPRLFLGGLACALAMKAAEALGIWAVQMSFGLALPWWSSLLVLACLSAATMVSVSPGNLGVYEASVFLIYQYLGVDQAQAVSLAVVQHLCYLIPLVGTGYAAVLRRNGLLPVSSVWGRIKKEKEAGSET